MKTFTVPRSDSMRLINTCYDFVQTHRHSSKSHVHKAMVKKFSRGRRRVVGSRLSVLEFVEGKFSNNMKHALRPDSAALNVTWKLENKSVRERKTKNERGNCYEQNKM